MLIPLLAINEAIMPGALGGGLLIIILGAMLFFLSLVGSGIIGRWIANWVEKSDSWIANWLCPVDDIKYGYWVCFWFWVVVFSFVIFFSRGNALPEFLLRPLLWLLGWPEPHK